MSSVQLQKQVIKEGDRTNYPKVGADVEMHYTGWLYDASAANNQYRGNQ
jgi:FKBP-type peptidyl-prolyl cis-trans isomerase